LIFETIKSGLLLIELPYNTFVKIQDIILESCITTNDTLAPYCFNVSTIMVAVYIDPQLHTMLALQGDILDIASIERVIKDFAKSSGFMVRLNYAKEKSCRVSK
jgi:hypothetical protein